MTPYKSGGRGSLIVDLKVRGIPIRKATGCKADRRGRADFAAIVAMLRSFGDPATENLDLLRDIAAGVRTIAEVFQAYRKGTVDGLATGPRATADLRATWTTWLERQGGGNKVNRRGALKALLAIQSDARVCDLPELTRTLVTQYVDAGKARTAIQHRMSVLSFLRDTLGLRHQVRLQVLDVHPPKHTAKKGHPQSVLEALAIRAQLVPRAAEHWWALCLTGMRAGEYFPRHWTAQGDTIEIRGTKNASAVRSCPLAEPIAAPTTSYKTFTIDLRKVTKGAVTAHDARRSCRIWMREAGIPRVDRDLFLGHEHRDMEALYEHQEAIRVMAEARRKLVAYLTEQRRSQMRRIG